MFIEITDCWLSDRKTFINSRCITKLVPQRPTSSDPTSCVVFMKNDFIRTSMAYEEVKELIEKV